LSVTNTDFANKLYSRGFVLFTASDKCEVESDCLPVGHYMKVATQLWMEHSSGKYAATDTGSVTPTSVIITTESRDVLLELANYTASKSVNKRIPFPVRIITNHHDVLQGTGFFEEMDHSSTSIKNVTADGAMLSAISSLRLQLATRVTTGNCCSNFHLLLSDFLRSGCGANNDNTFQCLQDNADPNLRPCCSWDKSMVCLSRKNRTSPSS